MQVFSKTWFLKHQSRLLKFANSFIGRRVLGIEEKGEVVKILPHCYTVKTGDVFKTDFRTHEKFGKRLYYRLKPLWHAIHWWDMLVANPLNPKWNFGFDTTTFYPDADAESTSVDGSVAYTGLNATWDSIHDASTGNSVSSNSAYGSIIQLITTGTTDRYQAMARSFFLFDTSGIDDSHIITDGTVSMYGSSSGATNGIALQVGVYDSTPASNTDLTTADYNAVGTTAQSDTTITNGSWDTAGYNDFPLNSTGIGNIDETGVTKFGCRDSLYDAPDTEPTWSASQSTTVVTFFADETGTSKDPKLVVTHYDPEPTVVTTSHSDVFEFIATVNADVTDDGNFPVTERGVVYDTSTAPTTSDTKLSVSGTTGAYTANITGLSADTTYYIRPFVSNAYETAYGSEIVIKTDEDGVKPVTIISNPAQFI